MKIYEPITLIGGGSGVYQVARYLKHSRPNISTIQTMFDSGGHSGILRDELGVLPPGDIRRAILALSDDKKHQCYRILLEFRGWPETSSLKDASLGNLVLSAFTLAFGNPITGIQCLSEICGVKGKVLPVTLDKVSLCARLSDNSVLCGEHLIDQRSPDDKRVISSVYLSTQANMYAGAHDAILEAKKIVFCPGDLFTSVIPNTLVQGFSDAIRSTKAKLIYVVNIMTKKSETPGFSASQFAETLYKYIGRKFDVVICNSGSIRPNILKSYREEKSEQVRLDIHRLKKFCREIVSENISSQSGGIIRHSPKVAKIIAHL